MSRANVNAKSKALFLTRLPHDPYMLALCSWKQEQIEGMGVVTFIVKNILKEYDVDQSRISAIKVSKITFTIFILLISDWLVSKCEPRRSYLH